MMQRKNCGMFIFEFLFGSECLLSFYFILITLRLSLATYIS